MSVWLEQFLKLIAAETGSLTYHLVLAFSAAGALALVANQDRQQLPARSKRTLGALVCLLLLQVTLFTLSGLTWQGVINGELLLPPLDRLVSILAMVILLWLWCFPDPSPYADIGSLLLGLVVVVSGVMTTLWWTNQAQEVAFNGSFLDQAAGYVGLGLAIFGLVIAALKRPAGYAYGAIMFFILGVGWGAHLALLPYGGDYPSILRLAQMIAYPFLLLAPQRFIAQPVELLPEIQSGQSLLETNPADVETAASASANVYAHPAIWDALTRLPDMRDPDDIIAEITRILAQVADADYCLWLTPPDSDGKITVRSAYDRLARRSLESKATDAASLPMISSAARMGRARRLSSGSSSPDLATFAELFGFEKSGNLLFIPLTGAEHELTESVVLLSPVSKRDWNQDAQDALAALLNMLAQFLHHSRETISLRAEISQTRQQRQIAQDQARQALEENQKLRGQIAVMQENAERDNQQISSLTAVAAAHEAALQQLERLRLENEQLVENIKMAQRNYTETIQAREGELRLALQEIALLNEALAQADNKIAELKMNQVDVSPSEAQFEAVASIAREVRQPLSSIIGYTDVLLGEAIGILGAKQRKYLERIRVSTDRISRLMDDLIQTTAPESNTARLEYALVDVREILQMAVVEMDGALQRKRVVVKLDVPANGLNIQSDRYALKKVFNQLLMNAGQASPEGGEVVVKAQLKTGDNDQDYVLVQISDCGAGISPADLTRVFSPRLDAEPIPGLGDSSHELPRMKQLIEAIGGRAWVDSEIGKGTTFSVVLPVSATAEQSVTGRDAA
jgi:signal transduction histidine kinase